MVRGLKTLTFLYDPREDRVMAAINAGHPDAWSCWLTRRLALAVLDRAGEYLTNTSDLAQRAPAELRKDMVAFERDAGMAKTARAMSITAPEVLKSSASAAELGDRLMIKQQGDGFLLELRGQSGSGAAGMLKRVELQRILQMLQIEVTKAAWSTAPTKPQSVAPIAATDPKPVRH